MTKTIMVSTLITVVLLGCGGGSESISDSAMVDELTATLTQENAQHYAFACADFEGSVLSRDFSPDAIARAAAIEHPAGSWASETSGVVVGGDEDKQYVVIHDPASEATNSQDFEEREIRLGDGKLACFVPR